MTNNKKHHHTKSVEISCIAPEAQEVLLGGTFNEWNPGTTPMRKTAGGLWRVTLELEPGTYEYKFQVDGNWVCQPGTDEFDPALLEAVDCTRNVFGSLNRKLVV